MYSIHICAHSLYTWAHKLNKHTSHFSLRKALSVTYLPQTFYLLGGCVFRPGLILSCRLEPVPRGQLTANTQQPLSTYSDHSCTFCYSIPTHTVQHGLPPVNKRLAKMSHIQQVSQTWIKASPGLKDHFRKAKTNITAKDASKCKP